MKKISKQRQAELGEFMAKIETAAKAEGKTTITYLAGQHDGLRCMFIRWYEEEIEKLKNIKSLHK